MTFTSDVPGNATGLDAVHHAFKEDDASDAEYKLSPHNTDHISQQLALLSGVAYLGQRALKNSIK